VPGEGQRRITAGTRKARDGDLAVSDDPVHGGEAQRWGGWHWSKPRHGEHFRRCSYCGSIHPEDLAAQPADDCIICGRRGGLSHDYPDYPGPGSVSGDKRADHPYQGGWHAEWADRKYGWPHKFYVDIPNRSPADLFIAGAQSGGHTRPDWKPPAPVAGEDGVGWVAFGDLTRSQRKIVVRDGWGASKDDRSDFYLFGTRTSHHAKFYTAHLADPALSADAKAAIERRSGLRFTFEDGRVGWESAA
jgi:hypothetical protein